MKANERSETVDNGREYTPYAKPDTDYRNSLERYPLCLLGKQNKVYVESYKINITEEVVAGDTERTLEKSWRLIASSQFGLPRGTDQDVYVALNEMLCRVGGMPAENVLHFTFYELLNYLGWETGGKMRQRLEESLQRMASTTIVARNVFYSSTRGYRVERTFKPFSFQVGIYEDFRHGLAEKHRLVFDPFFAEMWSQTYQESIDFSMYWQVHGHVARRLYRLVEDQARGSGKSRTRSWSVDLWELAYLMPLANYRYVSQLKRLVLSASDELVNRGFLSTYSLYNPKAESNSTLVVRFEVSRAFDNRRIAKNVESDPLRAIAIEKVVEVTAGMKGTISRNKATRMVEEYGAAYCLHYAELFLYQQPKGGGLLVSGIENGWDWERPAGLEGTKSFSTDPKPKGEDSSGGSPSGHGKSGDCQGTSRSGGETSGKDSDAGKGVTHHNSGSALTAWRGEQVTVEQRQQADEVLQEILAYLSKDGRQTLVGVFFEEIYALVLADGVLTLSVPNETAREYIGSKFGKSIESALSEILTSRGLPGEARLELVICDGGG